MPKKNPSIKYTSRDFNTIREDLIEYAKRYYPTTFRDFNEASFGSLMVDTVSYVGDILSFYVDYQANESFLDSAIEYDNVIRHARTMGYKFNPNPSSMGILTFYVLIPTEAGTITPDDSYKPILRKGSKFLSTAGNIFTLVEDVNFSNSEHQVIVGASDTNDGNPTSYMKLELDRSKSFEESS